MNCYSPDRKKCVTVIRVTLRVRYPISMKRDCNRAGSSSNPRLVVPPLDPTLINPPFGMSRRGHPNAGATRLKPELNYINQSRWRGRRCAAGLVKFV
ncbi:hypothetical protein PCASD_04273 [Puccinia coronata f. sp. avenae]|uniref:Uncharacterized protein n=1 Tax=Puccinia coronata f. sp. avenae TaxID=200324 RepID=A0A2N5VEZ1_9BASI|nr:hypothetical protein PCASD_04273 [Puccinia coronata f. sp. avenae]